jgi:G3E family GTPase
MTTDTISPSPTKARYIMIGGFLGAGKTTSVAKLAQHLTARGLRVGLITNDQGSELVDTAMLRARATEEIPGGCFCCRFNSLVDAAHRLTESTRPDVFIAEPVGSCTDLVATVTYPLRRLYGDSFAIAPLSVLVDPVRASRVLGLEGGGQFSEKVLYIYRKQLEEADLLVINKRELLTPERLAQLTSGLQQAFPKAEILAVSARTGEGLAGWFDRIGASDQPGGDAMAVDYEVYAEGEALLGWFNATVQVSSPKGVDGNVLVRELAAAVQQRLNAAGAEVAHLKMTLSTDEGLDDLAVVNLVRNDFVPELSQELSDLMEGGQLIINLRAEAPPETLHRAVNDALVAVGKAHPEALLRVEHLEHFRPGKPRPTHRIESLPAV